MPNGNLEEERGDGPTVGRCCAALPVLRRSAAVHPVALSVAEGLLPCRLLFLQEQWYRTANKDKIVQCPHPDCQFFYALEAEDLGGGDDGGAAAQDGGGEEDGDGGAEPFIQVPCTPAQPCSCRRKLPSVVRLHFIAALPPAVRSPWASGGVAAQRVWTTVCAARPTQTPISCQILGFTAAHPVWASYWRVRKILLGGVAGAAPARLLLVTLRLLRAAPGGAAPLVCSRQ